METSKSGIVRDTGFSVLYSPPQGNEPIADIILVHGLQGHPRRTWTFVPPTKSRKNAQVSQPVTPGGPHKPRSFVGVLSNPIRRSHSSSRLSGIRTTEDNVIQEDEGVYWPRDLLLSDCPNTRILVWGYDSIVTKGFQPANKSNLFSHARDLLYSLERERTPGRRIIFVAHSIGGLLVKEALRRSEQAEDESLRDIIKSTKGIVFLGTPHRGSSDFASLGDVMRKVAGTLLRVDSNGNIIRALGVDSPELELSRESFNRQWRLFEFQVKTFQESLPMTGVDLGILNEKIVPDVSSSLDDPRERAESLQANHTAMTRFSGSDDANYIKVGGELRRIVNMINFVDNQREISAVGSSPQCTTPSIQMSAETLECLDTLTFPTMMNRQRNIWEALTNTCDWFYESAEFKKWYSRNSVEDFHGLLWLKGKPGSGKSTIIKDAYLRTLELEGPRATVAAFFFNARGSDLEKTPLGCFRSIIHQLCRQDRAITDEFYKSYRTCKSSLASNQEVTWSQPELVSFLKRIFKQKRTRRAIIFCDALDECEENAARDTVYLFADICKDALAAGVDLNICLSSRHYPSITVNKILQIIMERSNQTDIATYVHAKFGVLENSEREVVAKLTSELINRASGIFLWAVLVSNLLLQDLDTGQPIGMLLQRLGCVPTEMENLYGDLCKSLKPEEREFSSRLIQWIWLADLEADDMEIQDVCLAVLVSREWSWKDLTSWGYNSRSKLPPTERLGKYIKTASRGLIEYNEETGSVQFIHETVREFFLNGGGLGLVDPRLTDQPLAQSYMMLIRTELEILEMN
ncbi:hypothetical protein K449DRAFT_373278, partial [Hypoxylon sp. EC38]